MNIIPMTIIKTNHLVLIIYILNYIHRSDNSLRTSLPKVVNNNSMPYLYLPKCIFAMQAITVATVTYF